MIIEIRDLPPGNIKHINVDITFQDGEGTQTVTGEPMSKLTPKEMNIPANRPSAKPETQNADRPTVAIPAVDISDRPDKVDDNMTGLEF